MKKNKILQLLNVLNGADDKTLAGFKAFDEGAQKLKDDLLKNIRANTLDDVNAKLSEVRKSMSLDPLMKAVESLKGDFYSALEQMASEMDRVVGEQETKSETKDKEYTKRHTDMDGRMEKMHTDLLSLLNAKSAELSNIRSEFNRLISSSVDDIKGQVQEVIGRIDKTEGDIKTISKDLDDKINITRNGGELLIKELKADLLSRLGSKGGGNMNRNIAIGGNNSVLSKYTDINLKAGNNVTLTYQNNETTKQVDITISATGGSGSVGGVIRSINTISTSQTAGNTAGTDYVYICSAGVKLDLPTASGNTNLYTIKNVSNSSVLVAGTIDNDVNGVIMPVKYTSVDIISNDTDWNIT